MIVAQLSDIHADGTAAPLARLDAVLRWLKPLRPDAIIVSGDLAEYEHAASYPAVRDRLDSMGVPFQVVPGNVDDHSGLRRSFGDKHAWGETGPLCSTLQVGNSLRVIGLDVTVAGAHHGDAGPILEWLRTELNSGGPPALVFQHQHPFYCGIDGKDRNNCRNNEALSVVLGKSKDTVLGLTCGHVHRPMFTRFAGLPASMAPSVARANRLKLDGKESDISDPPGLLIHHYADQRLVSHVVMVSQ